MQTADYELAAAVRTAPRQLAPPYQDQSSPESCADAGVPTSYGFRWSHEFSAGDAPGNEWARKLAEATPANVELLAWAGRPERQPPPDWWNDETDPFTTDPD